MNKVALLALISALTGCSVLLVFGHFVYTADLVASSLGYVCSLFVLPVALPIGLAVLALRVVSGQLTKSEQWSVVVIPASAVAMWLGYAYWALQHGPH